MQRAQGRFALGIRLFAALIALLAPSLAHAQAKPAPESWAGQLQAIGEWVAAQKAAPCAQRCFALDRMRITGDVGRGALAFEIRGDLLADGPVAVPLFGPPSNVRVDGVSESGKPAVIGFEGDHYFVYTSARHFVVRGTFTLDRDQAITVPGPLNALEADLASGRVVEGARLSGLAGATLHFDNAKGDAAAAEPTVFQLSRAVRVERETRFEYRLVMRSGKDLGVARLPLAYGEKVLDVTGSNGWHVEGSDLVLPTAGRAAEMTITGTLPAFTKETELAPDARSTYEWWLLESDAEHRVTVGGSARQIDVAQSPLPHTQPTARLYLAQRGQTLRVGVQALAGLEVLAAVVRDHDRTVVMTERGDLVSDETLLYDNNGIDYLPLTPAGRPIFLATDDKAERIMEGDAGMLVPLRTSSHRVRVQSLAQTGIALLGGRFDVPMPTYPLTASDVSVTVGLPRNVHAVAVLGGDKAHWAFDGGDVFACALGIAVAWLAFRTTKRRVLGGIALAGAWFVASPLYVIALSTFALAIVVWLARRLLTGTLRAVVLTLGGGALALATLIAMFAVRSAGSVALEKSARIETALEQRAYDAPSAPAPAGSGVATDAIEDLKARAAQTESDKAPAQIAAQGILQGVTPVALALPSYAHAVSASRELVTKDRPFQPRIYYVTDWVLLPLLGAWLVVVALLAYVCRDDLRALRARIAERLKQKDPAIPAPATPAAP